MFRRFRPSKNDPAAIARLRARVMVTLALMTSLVIGSTSQVAAESDRLGDQCISVSGAKRGCAYYFSISWGAGISWQASGQLVDATADGWSNTVELKLNRPGMSDTAWMQVLRAGDWQTHTWSIKGSDPTRGAWVRLCSSSPRGVKYCNPSRYVTDNS